MANIESQPDEFGSHAIAAEEAAKVPRAFDKLTRELSDDELDSPGARKLLLERLAQAEEEIKAIGGFRERYHQVDKLNCALSEKLKRNTAAEVISTGTIAVGAAALVYAPDLWSNQPAGWIAVAFGAVLTLVGVVAKVI
ncbi:MAG TPA: hypothetical protein VIY53_21195 [Acidobacteriaceae bacterium]